MEFWGHEVKPGATVSCEAGDGFVIHLSQAALGETKKGSENVVIFVKVGDKKLVLGTLSADKHPQISCDLIFDEAFELSHNSKTSSVFLCGYKSVMPDMFESDSCEDCEDEDEEMENDEIPVKSNKAEKSVAKFPAKGGKKDKQDVDNDSDSETSSGTDGLLDSDSEDDGLSEDDSGESGSEDDTSEDDDLSNDSEDEETPVPEVGKKRAAATTVKTPASDKKAKISTPKEAGDKKNVHVATPHPAKRTSKTPTDSKLKEKVSKTPVDSKLKEKALKTPADSKLNEKSKNKSPKSGSHSCKSCSKTFNSAGALDSHQKSKKHEA